MKKKRKGEMKIVPLEHLLLSQATYDAWQAVAAQVEVALQALAEAGRPVDPAIVPDEQARIEDDGSLTIFVAIPNLFEVSLWVPPGEWRYTDA